MLGRQRGLAGHVHEVGLEDRLLHGAIGDQLDPRALGRPPYEVATRHQAAVPAHVAAVGIAPLVADAEGRGEAAGDLAADAGQHEVAVDVSLVAVVLREILEAIADVQEQVGLRLDLVVTGEAERVLVAIQRLHPGVVVEADVRPHVVEADRPALGDAVLDRGRQDVRVAANPPRQLGARRIAGPREIFLEVELETAGEVEQQVAEHEVVLGVLAREVEVAQDLRPEPQVDLVAAHGQLEHEARNRLGDDVVLGPAVRLEDVRLVLEPLGEERGDLEARQAEIGPDGVQVDGGGRPRGQSDRSQEERGRGQQA